MTLAKSSAAKLFVAFVAVAMALTLMAPAAQAQTEAELQAQIDQLLATIASLQAQVGGGEGGGSMSCAYTFTMAMGQGDTGVQVMNLQKFLNMDPETRVAVSGAGSAGMETQYYGPATAAAVSKFQVKYRADVLTPSGLVNPTGYFGSASMAKANALCDGGMTGGDDDDDDDSTSGDLDGGEASLDGFNGSDGDDTSLEEGQEEASVADFEFDVEDGDVEVNRIDVQLVRTGDGEDEPWEAFTDIAIWVDGDEIASEDVSDEDDWLDEDDGTYRFSGLDWVVREGETAEFSVVVTVANSVDGADNTNEWEVKIPADGVRGEDGEGIQNYVPEAVSDAVNFDIDEEGDDDELTISSSSDDPEATTFQLEDDETSDWITILAFELDADDSVNDIEVNDLRVDVVATEDGSTATSTSNLINDVRLVVDGDEVGDETINHGTTASTTFEFDSEELVVEAGEMVTVEYQVEFKALTTALEGATVQANIDTDGAEAEGADDLTAGTNLDGAATGEEHTLRTSGVTLALVEASKTLDENDDSTTTDNEGEFTIEFEVTAFENDIFIDKVAASGTALGTGTGANFLIEDSAGAQVVGGTNSAVLTSSAPTESGQYRVDEGETETFTLTVIYNGATGDEGDFFRAQLYSVSYTDTAGANMESQQIALPAEDFETDPLSI